MNTANTQPYVRLNGSIDDAPRGQPINQQNQQQPQEIWSYHQPTNHVIGQPPQQPQTQYQQLQQQQVQIQPISQPVHQIYSPPAYNQSAQPQQQYPPAQYMVQLPAMSNANNINNPNQIGYQGQWHQVAALNPLVAPGNLQQGSLKIPSSRLPEQFYCDFCKQVVNSKVIFKNGQGTYLAGFIIGLCGLWLGCCLIPCALDDCKDAQHICSNCGVDIGAKRFLFD